MTDTSGVFSLTNFVKAANPIIMSIAGISFFISIVILGYSAFTMAGKKGDERTEFFEKILWYVVGSLIVGSASGITILFFAL